MLSDWVEKVKNNVEIKGTILVVVFSTLASTLKGIVDRKKCTFFLSITHPMGLEVMDIFFCFCRILKPIIC